MEKQALYWTVRGPYGPHRYRHGLFTSCLQSLKLYGARKLIMHTLKLYGPPNGEAKFVRRRKGPVWAPSVDAPFLFKTARDQPVQGPGVWCDASVTSHSRAPYGLFPGCFEQTWYVHSQGLYGTVRCRTNVASLYRARGVGIISLRTCTGLEIIHSPWTARAGPVRAPYGHIRRKFWLCQFPYVSIRVPCGSPTPPPPPPRIWKTLDIPLWGPYGHCKGSMWSPANYSKFKCTAVSSRTGPVA